MGTSPSPNLAIVWLWFYNISSCLAWAIILYEALLDLFALERPSQAWADVSPLLLAVQTTAALEVVHSMVGWVRSPLVPTFLQVLSRVQLLWVFTYNFKSAQRNWSLYLLVISWSLSEVPRYLYYALHLITDVPYSIFWLRYSLFMVLYPTGICGEILQIVSSLRKIKTMGVGYWYLTALLLLLYVPGGPFMYFHMLVQRKNQMKARREKGKPPARSCGVDFPLDKNTMQRSTTIVNQGAFAASVKDVDADAAAAVAREKNWRFGYAKHVVKNVEICCRSNATCLKVAKAGLSYLYTSFDFTLPNGDAITFDEAMHSRPGKYVFSQDALYTYIVKGTKKRDPKFEYSVPYQKFGESAINNLRGKDLLAQLDKWAACGTIEPEARDAIAAMVDHPEFHSTSLSNKAFVLLGAGSAMGPLRVLLELGATIIAVDIDREPVWKKLVSMARDSPGTMIIPLKQPPEQLKGEEEILKCAGADLLAHTPQIRDWIAEQQPGQQLVLGGYAYLDAALFVRLAMAMDGIIEGVMAKRKDAAAAFLCSPTDVFVTSDAAHEARKEALKRAPLWQSLLRKILPKRMLVPNALKQVKSEDGTTFSIVDGLSVAQGPNYALAKRIQHWRCMIAREEGHLASTNIAPSTATQSVVHNPAFAAAYIGMKYFSPIEIVYQDLSNSVMTALLLSDLSNPKSSANPKVKLDNQIRLFAAGSFHGGIWRMAFKMNSIGEVAGLIGYSKIYWKVLYALLGVFVAFVAAVFAKGPPHVWM